MVRVDSESRSKSETSPKGGGGEAIEVSAELRLVETPWAISAFEMAHRAIQILMAPKAPRAA